MKRIFERVSRVTNNILHVISNTYINNLMDLGLIMNTHQIIHYGLNSGVLKI